MNPKPESLDEWPGAATAGLERNIRQRLELELSRDCEDALLDFIDAGTGAGVGGLDQERFGGRIRMKAQTRVPEDKAKFKAETRPLPHWSEILVSADLSCQDIARL